MNTTTTEKDAKQRESDMRLSKRVNELARRLVVDYIIMWNEQANRVSPGMTRENMEIYKRNEKRGFEMVYPIAFRVALEVALKEREEGVRKWASIIVPAVVGIVVGVAGILIGRWG